MFPDAPSAEEVIQGLKKHPVTTLSPAELLDSKVNASIGLAYKYLSQQLKLLCTNLSHFPGSFDIESASFFFSFSTDMLDELVRRSLLQSSHGRRRFHFHQLLKNFFLSQETATVPIQEFNTRFQLYYTSVVKNIITDYENNLGLKQLDEEKDNICHMLTLFETAKNATVTFNAIGQVLFTLQMNILQLRFSLTELHIISSNMLGVLDSFTNDEQAKVTSYFETYVRVVKLVSDQQSPISMTEAIKTLASRRKKVDEAFQKEHVCVSTFTNFYSLLAQYYKENGEIEKSSRCHTHILKTIHGQLTHCDPDCDYFSIAVAYEDIGHKEHAFKFRELAHEHQFLSLGPMEQAKLILYLHSDYLNESLGNNETKADNLSACITSDIYPYLMRVGRARYSEEVYYAAVNFFQMERQEERAILLQSKMNEYHAQCNCSHPLEKGEYFPCINSLLIHLMDDPTSLITRCEFKCANNYIHAAEKAFNRQCYHLAIWLGEKSCQCFNELEKTYHVLEFVPSSTIGLSYIRIENYSATQTWLTQALHYINDALSLEYTMELQKMRANICLNLVLNGKYFDVFCYGYLIRTGLFSLETTTVVWENGGYTLKYTSFVETFYIVWEKLQQTKITFSKVTEVAEQIYIYSFHWPKTHGYYIIEKVKDTIKNVSPFFLFLCVLSIPALFIVCVSILVIKYCDEGDSPYSVYILLIMCIFILGLDWLY